MIFRTCFACSMVAIYALPARADLILDLSGTVGSTSVSFVASGSITVANATTGESANFFGRAPVAGTWSTSFDNNIGDAVIGSSNDLNRIFSSNISYRLNNNEFGQIEGLDFSADPDPGDDDIQLDTAGAITYPSLSAGDIVSWTGSGSFNLSQNVESYLAAGSFGNSIDGGDFVVNISINAVPEPSGCIAVLFVGWACFQRQRKRQIS